MESKYKPGQYVTWDDRAGWHGDGIIKQIYSDGQRIWYAISDLSCWVEEKLIDSEPRQIR